MPKIVIITALHLIIALVSGYVLGMSVFALGFSDSEATKSTYSFLVYTWFFLRKRRKKVQFLQKMKLKRLETRLSA